MQNPKLTNRSGTSEMKAYHFNRNGYNVVLVDTPGFNDTVRSDTEVLLELAQWLEVTYKKDCKLTGIIYLHRITDVRMDGTGIRNLKIFRKICGDDPLKNVVIASTFWGCISHEKAVAHEEELCSDPEFWGGMLEHGAQTARFIGDQQSGWDIVLSFAKMLPVTLELQQELVVDATPLPETAVGQVVSESLAALELTYKEKIAKLLEEKTEALAEKDAKLEEALEKAQERMQRKLDKVRNDQEILRAERRAESRKMENLWEQKYRLLKMESEQQLVRERLEMGKIRANNVRERVALEEELSKSNFPSIRRCSTRNEELTAWWTSCRGWKRGFSHCYGRFCRGSQFTLSI